LEVISGAIIIYVVSTLNCNEKAFKTVLDGMSKPNKESSFLVTSSFVKCMELMKTSNVIIKRIFLPVHTKQKSESSISAFDIAVSLSKHPQHRTTPLVLVLDIGEELTEEQEHKKALYPFVGGVLRMPLNTREFLKFL
jgi:hypothetical protein